MGNSMVHQKQLSTLLIFYAVTLNITAGRGWGELSPTSCSSIPILWFILWPIYRQYQLWALCMRCLNRVKRYKKHLAGVRANNAVTP